MDTNFKYNTRFLKLLVIRILKKLTNLNVCFVVNSKKENCHKSYFTDNLNSFLDQGMTKMKLRYYALKFSNFYRDISELCHTVLTHRWKCVVAWNTLEFKKLCICIWFFTHFHKLLCWTLWTTLKYLVKLFRYKRLIPYSRKF